MTNANNNGEFTANEVNKGDLIRSADWNDVIKEIKRLGKTTSYLDNNVFKGPLTIEGALKVEGNGDIETEDNQAIVTIEGDLTVKGPLTIEETLNVKGNVDIGTETEDNQAEVTIKGDLTVIGDISGNIHADEITDGELDPKRIPDLSASKITDGELDPKIIPNLSADKITGGTIEGNLTVTDVLKIGDEFVGGDREWMTKGMKIGWSSDNLFIGFKDEDNNRKDAVIAWGDDANDNLRFINTLSGGDPDGNEVMKLSPGGNVDVGGNLQVKGNLFGAVKGPNNQAFRIAVGVTKPGADWRQQQQSDNKVIFTQVNTSSAKFSSTPYYFTSLVGKDEDPAKNKNYWKVQGTTSIYSPSKNSFQIYLFFPDKMTPQQAEALNLSIHWVAIGS